MAPDFMNGLNSVLIAFLAHHRPFLLRLTEFVQICLRNGFPASASEAGTILIPKRADTTPAQLSETRPIAINPSISKLAKTVLARRLLAALDPTISDQQFGFRPRRSTARCFQHLFNAWDDKSVVTAFIDIRKAFDTVTHKAVLTSLRRFRVPEHFVDILSRYLAAARTKFYAGDAVSNVVTLHRGLLQGCPLSPILFILCTDFILSASSPTADSAFADDISVTGKFTAVVPSITRVIPALASAGLQVNCAKSGFISDGKNPAIRIGDAIVFEQSEPIIHLGFPTLRSPAKRRVATFQMLLRICRQAVPVLFQLSYQDAVRYINSRLAPRVAYLSQVATFTKTQLKQLDAPIVQVLMRHPGKYHLGSVSKGALYAIFQVQFPSSVAMRSRMYHVNSFPSLACSYATEMNIALPLPHYRLKAAMNAFFYARYTAAWFASRSGELIDSCRPLLRELRRLPAKRKPFALAFITNTLPTAHTMHRIGLRSEPDCVCGRGACTSRHILKWHAKMSLKHIHWKQLMCVARSLLLRLPK